MKYNCIKQTVVAVIITPSGEYFTGSNWCKNYQETCPRVGMETGQGYELCKSVCGQNSHAEVDACRNAGDKISGATLYLIGHSYCCEDCKMVMEAAGIVNVVFSSQDKQ